MDPEVYLTIHQQHERELARELELRRAAQDCPGLHRACPPARGRDGRACAISRRRDGALDAGLLPRLIRAAREGRTPGVRPSRGIVQAVTGWTPSSSSSTSTRRRISSRIGRTDSMPWPAGSARAQSS